MMSHPFWLNITECNCNRVHWTKELRDSGLPYVSQACVSLRRETQPDIYFAGLGVVVLTVAMTQIHTRKVFLISLQFSVAAFWWQRLPMFSIVLAKVSLIMQTFL